MTATPPHAKEAVERKTIITKKAMAYSESDLREENNERAKPLLRFLFTKRAKTTGSNQQARVQR